MTTEPIASVDELLAAYADDPTSLTAAERAAVEARLADPAVAAELTELRAVLADVRAHGDVADAGTDWAALEAQIRGAVTPAPRRARWAVGAGVALAAAAAVALWWHGQRTDDGPGLGLARLLPTMPVAAPAGRAVDPSIGPAGDPSIDPAIDPVDDAIALELDDDDDLGSLAADDDGDGDDDVSEEALIGRALERVPVADGEDLFPATDTEWIDDLSEVEVEQALRWLDQQGAG